MGTTGQTVDDETERPRPERPVRFRFVRRHKALVILLVLLLLLTSLVFGWAFYLNAQLGRISRFDLDLDRPGRPVRPAGDAVTVLLVGVDSAQTGTSFRSTMAQEDWEFGSYRSDAILVVHLEADRSGGQVVSIPRDSYVPVAGYGRTKINAAFSYGGPELLARTVEDTAGIYLDHVIVIDFAGFEEVSRIVDGVPITLTRAETLGGTKYDVGEHALEGAAALDYVRQRYSLPRGDFDRVQRQQNFLRGLLDRLGDLGAGDALVGTRLAGELSELVAVDDDLTNGRIRTLSWGARSLEGETFRYFTVPFEGTDTVDGASIVRLDVPATRQMFAAIRDGRIDRWATRNEVDELSDSVR